MFIWIRLCNKCCNSSTNMIRFIFDDLFWINMNAYLRCISNDEEKIQEAKMLVGDIEYDNYMIRRVVASYYLLVNCMIHIFTILILGFQRYIPFSENAIHV